jgi:hypothetical protein
MLFHVAFKMTERKFQKFPTKVFVSPTKAFMMKFFARWFLTKFFHIDVISKPKSKHANRRQQPIMYMLLIKNIKRVSNGNNGPTSECNGMCTLAGKWQATVNELLDMHFEAHRKKQCWYAMNKPKEFS